MKRRNVFMAILVCVCVCAIPSAPAFAEEGVDELEWLSEMLLEEPDIASEQIEVGASYAAGHGTIMVHPDVYDSVYVNNSDVQLTFDVRSFGNSLEGWKIKIYRGDVNVQGNYKLVAVQSGDFEAVRGSKTITLKWDTRNTSEITEGRYTIVCTSYYYTTDGKETVNQEDMAYVAIEDYHRILDRQFVSRLYQKVLKRNADAEGLAQWSNDLYDHKRTGAQVVQHIFESPEFLSKETTEEEYIELLYQAVFDRSSDPSGLATWQGVLEQGMSRTYVLKGFMESGEFDKMCQNYSITKGSIDLIESRDQNPGVTAFVSRLYNLALNRRPDVLGLNDWTNRLLTKKQTPKQVASGFVFSNEMKEKKLNDADFVTMLYNTMLNRAPEPAGLQDWVGRLQDKSFTREKVFDGFADSVEFGDIVKSYGIK